MIQSQQAMDVMKSPSDKPHLQVKLCQGHLEPLTRHVATLMEEYSEGQLFDITAVAYRSNPHHALYWATLQKVINSTDRWATKDHLHSDLKMLCGYYRTVINGLTGELYYVPDSIAFSKMDQKEFSMFFDKAMEKLTQAIGYDPLD